MEEGETDVGINEEERDTIKIPKQSSLLLDNRYSPQAWVSKNQRLDSYVPSEKFSPCNELEEIQRLTARHYIYIK